MWTIYKVFTESVTILLLFYVLVFSGHEACGILARPTRGQTFTPLALVLVVAHGIFHCSVQILWLWHTCSVVGAQGPSFKACGILVPWPGIEPTSPALQGRFLITGPPGMSLTFFFYLLILYWSIVPGESHGQRSLVNYSPLGHKESDRTEAI